jgi:hypothetical protein
LPADPGQPEIYLNGVGDAFDDKGQLTKEALQKVLQQYIDASRRSSRSRTVRPYPSHVIRGAQRSNPSSVMPGYGLLRCAAMTAGGAPSRPRSPCLGFH